MVKENRLSYDFELHSFVDQFRFKRYYMYKL